MEMETQRSLFHLSELQMDITPSKYKKRILSSWDTSPPRIHKREVYNLAWMKQRTQSVSSRLRTMSRQIRRPSLWKAAPSVSTCTIFRTECPPLLQRKTQIKTTKGEGRKTKKRRAINFLLTLHYEIGLEDQPVPITTLQIVVQTLSLIQLPLWTLALTT